MRAVPSLRKVADSECEAEGLFNGKRLGSSYRLAVYSLAVVGEHPESLSSRNWYGNRIIYKSFINKEASL